MMHVCLYANSLTCTLVSVWNFRRQSVDNHSEWPAGSELCVCRFCTWRQDCAHTQLQHVCWTGDALTVWIRLMLFLNVRHWMCYSYFRWTPSLVARSSVSSMFHTCAINHTCSTCYRQVNLSHKRMSPFRVWGIKLHVKSKFTMSILLVHIVII